MSRKKELPFGRPRMIHEAMLEFERVSGVSATVGNIWYGVIAAIDAAFAYSGKRRLAGNPERRTAIARAAGKASAVSRALSTSDTKPGALER